MNFYDHDVQADRNTKSIWWTRDLFINKINSKNFSDLSNREYAILGNCNTFQRAESINYIFFYSWIKLEMSSKKI